MASDLVAFLSARLDEDEAAARTAGSVAGPDWQYEQNSDIDPAATWLIGKAGGLLGVTMRTDDEEIAPFIVRHDPVRVLREVEAGRRLLTAYGDALGWLDDYQSDDCGWDITPEEKRTWADWYRGAVEALQAAVALRATVYRDHPDYDPAWNL
jgi:Family of unknown function (DUF6221)